MDLREIFSRCQDEHGDDWVTMPGGTPGERFVTGFIDVAASDEPPALATLQGHTRAIYVPRPEIGLVWGVPGEDWRTELEFRSRAGDPEWMPSDWSGAELKYALVLLNGTPLWQIGYAYANLGAGRGGPVPWPDSVDGKLTTTKWELSFTRLLAYVEGSDGGMTAASFKKQLGGQVFDVDPIDWERGVR